MESVLWPGKSTGPYLEEGSCDAALFARYSAIASDERLGWLTEHRKLHLLGSGGQGLVYLCEREGADHFTLPVALKIFSPLPYRDEADYQENMRGIAEVAARVALIQHDNVVDVHDFVEKDGIRVMQMEWVDGYDLACLLSQDTLDRAQQRVSRERWSYLNDVIVTAGVRQPRLKPGIAIQVLRECLAGLAALHRAGIVHGDLKPSNIMLKRTGNAKVIDIGSATHRRTPAGRRAWSPVYAAPEVLAGGDSSPQSDLASLGYVLVEMLAGQCPFAGLETYPELRRAKQELEGRLGDLLPREVSGDELLLNLCRRLIAANPAQRCPSAEAADLERQGASDFHRQLVKGDLASDYRTDIRVWLEQLG